MSSPTATEYDRVAYPSMSHPQTFAENLAIKGLLRGIEVAPPDNCRVLELGCGDGFNLAAMATAYPRSHYTGLDYAAEVIARGRTMTAALGLTNVQLETADIRNLRPDLGEFDYIIAHGVYSWVPADVRTALLATIGRHLAPNGVAFVSYLALPGACLREMSRLMMRFHVQKESDPAARIAQGRALMTLIANATDEKNHYSEWIKTEARLIEEHSDEAFFHDELSDESAPVLFTDFLAQAEKHGLHFLAEAEYLIPVGRLLTEKTREHLRPLEQNRVLLEQYLDFMEGRRFRQTLLCRPGKGATLETTRIDRLHVGFMGQAANADRPLTAGEPLEFKAEKNAAVMARTPLEKATLLTLVEAGQPMPYPALRAAAHQRLLAAGIEPDEDLDRGLRKFLIRAAVPGLVELSWFEPRRAFSTPVKPRTSSLARWLLSQGSTVVPTIGGKFVEINGVLGLHLLSLLDGTRDRAAVETEIREFLAAHHREAAASGATATLPPPTDPTLSQQLVRSLNGLTALGLIYRD